MNISLYLFLVKYFRFIDIRKKCQRIIKSEQNINKNMFSEYVNIFV